jgi:hypothetical protein
LVCVFCKKRFKTQSSASRHIIHRCVVLQKRHKENDDRLRDLEKQEQRNNFEVRIKNLEDKIDELTIHHEKNERNLIVHKIFQGINPNIVPLGKENIDIISGQKYKKMISNPVKTNSFLTEIINFDVETPNNWNILKLNNDFIIFLNNEGIWTVKSLNNFVEILFSIKENQSYDIERKFKAKGKTYTEAVNNFDYKILKMNREIYNGQSIRELHKTIIEGINLIDLYIKRHHDDIIKYFKFDV